MRDVVQDTEKNAETIVSVSQKVPLAKELADLLLVVDSAQMRGYFLPDEDLRLRESYLYYLRVRAVLLEVVDALAPGIYKKENKEECLQLFVSGFTAACVLMRASRYIVEVASDRFLVWKKLDEPELRYGVERGSFSKIYKSLSSPRRMWRFYRAVEFFEGHREEILQLREKGGVWRDMIELLERELPFVQKSRGEYVQRRLKYQLFSFKRRHYAGYKKVMFHVFRAGGRVISELKQPHLAWMKRGKRVTPRVMAKAWAILKPGDVIITRHDDALSNLFLPGYWPHAAFYVGSEAQRRSMGIEVDVPDGMDVVEAKKDGVKFRRLLETLSVDAFLVMRPRLNAEELSRVIENAVSHVGKRYDFVFDFRQADRLACTAVVYRAFHSVGVVSYELREVSGRLCLPAECLIDQSLSSGAFEVAAIYGVKGVKVLQGDLAKEVLRGSYAAQW